ncbi:MAG TPA: hypothetical protein VIH86_05705 [Puia sp.]|jgi:hypothetical protein
MSGISGPKKDEIVNRQLCHFFRADIGLGMAVAKGLGVDAAKAMPKQHTAKNQLPFSCSTTHVITSKPRLVRGFLLMTGQRAPL